MNRTWKVLRSLLGQAYSEISLILSQEFSCHCQKGEKHIKGYLKWGGRQFLALSKQDMKLKKYMPRNWLGTANAVLVRRAVKSPSPVLWTNLFYFPNLCCEWNWCKRIYPQICCLWKVVKNIFFSNDIFTLLPWTEDPDPSGRCYLCPSQLQNELWCFFFSTRSVIPSSARDRHFPSTAQSTAQDVLHNLFRSWHGLRLWIIIFRLIFSPGIIMFLAVASFLLPLPDSYRALQKLQKNLRH